MNICDNNRPCPCTYDCPRHGKCCACVAHHRDNNEGVPGCFFQKRRRRPTTEALKIWQGIRGSCKFSEGSADTQRKTCYEYDLFCENLLHYL